MRKLTVKNRRSFWGVFQKVTIYIEDHTSSEIVINNTPCRLLGVLLNGDEKTFEIGNKSAKLYAIEQADLKEFFFDFYRLEAGDSDIAVSGQVTFFSGGGFVFDGNEKDPDVKAVRARFKKKMKAGLTIIFLITITVMCVILFCNDLAHRQVTHTSNGMSITIDKDFEEKEIPGVEVAFLKDHVSIYASKRGFTPESEIADYTVEEYVRATIDHNGVDGEPQIKDGLVYWKYEFTPEDGKTVYCAAIFYYKTENAFWAVEFVTAAKEYEAFSYRIFKWAASVEFN